MNNIKFKYIYIYTHTHTHTHTHILNQLCPFQKLPSHALSTNAQCERALGDLIIMLAPFCPMFGMALWDSLRKATPHVYDGFKWVSDILYRLGYKNLQECHPF